eukprot:PhF_6_TR7340/c0_g1_i1/m.11030
MSSFYLNDVKDRVARIASHNNGEGRIVCYLCGQNILNTASYISHVFKCLKITQAAVDALPDELRRDLPLFPEYPNDLKKFNDNARRSYYEDVCLWCPKCDTRYDPRSALKHFERHHQKLSVKENDILLKERKTNPKGKPKPKEENLPHAQHPSVALFEMARQKCLEKGGPSELVYLRKTLHIFSIPRDGRLTVQEVAQSLRKHGINYSDQNVDVMCSGVQKDKWGWVSAMEVFQRIRGVVPANRVEDMVAAFDRVDTRENNRCSVHDLFSHYKVQKHPAVVAKQSTVDDEKIKFLQAMLPRRTTDKLSRRNFVEIFGGVSASIPSDENFSKIMDCFEGDDKQLSQEQQGQPVKVRVRATMADGSSKIMVIETCSTSSRNMARLLRNIGYDNVVSVKALPGGAV